MVVLITCLLDVVLVLKREILFWSLMRVKNVIFFLSVTQGRYALYIVLMHMVHSFISHYNKKTVSQVGINLRLKFCTV